MWEVSQDEQWRAIPPSGAKAASPLQMLVRDLRQERIAGRCLLPVHSLTMIPLEIRPPPPHTHAHTGTYTQSPKRGYSLLYPGHRCLTQGKLPEPNWIIKFYSGIWNSGNRNMAVGDIQLKCVSCKSSGRFTDSSVQTCLCLRNVRPSLLLFVDIHCPTVTGWIVSPYSDLLET